MTLLDGALVKTVGFRRPRYVGDPINAVKIFNEKEVDELVVLDIGVSRRGGEVDSAMIADLADEAFMPIAYGGGVTSADQAARLSALGVEKIILDSAAIANPPLISDIAARLGSSSTLASISVKRDWRGTLRVFDPASRRRTALDPLDHARRLVELGAGEIMLNDVDRDGSYRGFDLKLVEAMADAVDVPLIACGGAATVADLAAGVKAGASAVAAGSQFMFMGPHRAVLINYPDEAELATEMP
jgi:imidazole glycerol-phosphate synthase subunit HisF